MNIHGLIDNIAVGLGARFMPKYFRDGAESQTVAENLQHLSLTMPAMTGEGDYEIPVQTLVGELHAGFRVARWMGESHPAVIYHHGASEIPFDYGFKRLFPLQKEPIPANFFLVRAPFHRSMKEFQQGIHTLANVVAMLAVSVCLIEQLVQYNRETGSSKIIVAGTSLGGFITNLHHIHFNTADIYTPLLAGLAMDDAYLRSVYSKAVAAAAKEKPAAIEAVLNFTSDFAAQDNGNVFPLLAMHDQLIRFAPQKASYGEIPVEIIPKGHTTGALAYKQLREHVLKPLG